MHRAGWSCGEGPPVLAQLRAVRILGGRSSAPRPWDGGRHNQARVAREVVLLSAAVVGRPLARWTEASLFVLCTLPFGFVVVVVLRTRKVLFSLILPFGERGKMGEAGGLFK